MSSRRFVAYFFAIAAGSTFAFASTLRGQPAPVGMPASENGMVMTATDAGLDALPPGPARLFRQGWDRRRHAPVTRPRLGRVGRAGLVGP